MIEIALSREEPWPPAPSGGEDWDALADRAARAAVARTPYADLLASPSLVEVSVRLADDEEVRVLNRDYRAKDKPTNVLSFPMIEPDLIPAATRRSDEGEVLLGDVVLAHGVCAAEAAERGVTTADHATHLLVHGVLHLLGYDHMTDEEAGAMEAIERDALRSLGLPDPYLVRED